MEVTKRWIWKCEAKLIQAAIDLATFTQNGIYAKDIAGLAVMCEELQRDNSSSENSDTFRQKQKKLIEGIQRICEVGRKAWAHKPEKYQYYVWQS